MSDVSMGGAGTPRSRLKLCSNLLTLREKINASDGGNKIKVSVMAKRRMSAIRRVLLGRGAVSLSDELLSPQIAGARLLAELKAVKDKPEHERVAAASYVRAIIKTLRVIQDAESTIGMGMDAQGFTRELLDAANAILSVDDDEIRKRADPVIDDCIGRGAFGDELRAELATAVAGGTDADVQVSSFVRMKAEAYDKVLAQQQAMYKDVIAIRSNPDIDQAAIDEAYKEYYDFLDEVMAPVGDARNEVILAERKKASNAFARVGVKLIATVMNASPITPDAAALWAKAQEITPPAVARLRKIGYPLEKVRADMAEFYRFTAGRVATVRIHSNGSRRANATDIEAHGKVGTIHLDASFDKRVLWHELAHHMEADPVAKLSAGQFIRRRSVDGTSHSLRSLTKNPGYRSDEVAFKGDFFSPYVGKIYRDGVTEVFSMGVESFSNPEMLARRAADDPQTLEFVAGFVKAPVSPLAKAHMSLREIVREMQDDVTDAVAESKTSLIQALAATVKLTPDTDTQWLGGRDWELSKWKQIGRFEESGYYLLAGKVRNWQTKRQTNGFVLANLKNGWVHRTEITGTDQDTVKAMFAIYRESGIMPSIYSMDDGEFLRKNAR